MKKKLCIIIPSLILTAALLVGCNVKWGVSSRNKNNNLFNFTNDNENNGSTYSENINETFPMDDIENVNIETSVSNVTINSVDESKFSVICKGSSSVVDKTTVEVKNGTLNVIEHGIKSSFNFNLVNTSVNREVIINIPKEFNKDLTLSFGAGDVNINEITAKNLDIEGGAGDLNLKNVVFKDLQLGQGVGDIDVDLSKKSGDMDIQGGVGSITLRLSEVGGNLKYNGGVGEANIYIPNNSPVKIESSSGVGSMDINAKTSGEDTYIFDLELGVGSVTVN